ncbi:hypothetical protein SMICM304S_02080 [Streptomyces microflavus]
MPARVLPASAPDRGGPPRQVVQCVEVPSGSGHPVLPGAEGVRRDALGGRPLVGLPRAGPRGDLLAQRGVGGLEELRVAHQVQDGVRVPGPGHDQPAPLQEGGAAEPVEYLRRDPFVGEGEAAGVALAQGGVQVRRARLRRVGLLEYDIGQMPGVAGIGQQLGGGVPPVVGGGHPQIEQCGTAPQVQSAAVRVTGRQRARRVAVQGERAGTRAVDEPPGLGVVHGRCGDGVLDQRGHGLHGTVGDGHGFLPVLPLTSTFRRERPAQQGPNGPAPGPTGAHCHGPSRAQP